MSKNRNFSKLVNSVDDTGKIANNSAISPDALRSVESYDSINLLPTSGLTNADRALVGDRLFISNGSGWYNFSLINLNPRITSGPSGNFIQLDSTASQTVTITAADSDGTPIIWEYIASDSAFDLATISSDSNGVFTVTGKSLTDILAAGYDSSGGSFTVSFKASDGIAFDADSATFDLSYRINYLLNATILTAPQSNYHFELDSDSMVVYTQNASNGGSAQILVKDDEGAFSAQQLLSSTPNDTSTSYTSYYRNVAIDGDTAVLVSDMQEFPGWYGSVSIFTRSGSTWTLQQKIPNPQAFDRTVYFGFGGVALDGDTLAVGNGITFVDGRGSIYIYTRSGSTWTLQDYITDVRNSDNIGQLTHMDIPFNLQLEGDILTFSHAHNTSSGTGGQIITYKRSGSTWTWYDLIWLGDVTGTTGERTWEGSFVRKGNEIYQLWPYYETPVRQWTLNSNGIATGGYTDLNYDVDSASPLGNLFPGIDFTPNTVLAFNTTVGGNTRTYVFDYIDSDWSFRNTIMSSGTANGVRTNTDYVYVGFESDGTDGVRDYERTKL